MSNSHVHPAFDLDSIYASLRVTPPTRPDAEAIPGREDLDSDELVDGGVVGAVSQEREE